MADMTLADLLAAPAGQGPIDWNMGQISPDMLRYELMIEAERARQAREADKGLSIYSAFPQITPEAQLYLGGDQYGGATPQMPPVEGLRLPQPRAAMDPVGAGVSLADWIGFQGWVPGRTAQQPGDPYQGPIPPIPADRIDRTKQVEAALEPAKKPAKRREEPRAKPSAATKTARSKSGKTFVVGKIYTNAQGQRFRFRADGSFEKVK